MAESRTLKQRVDFLERTINKLWDEHYKLEQKVGELEKVKK
jgi:hypothetical protein